MFRMQRAESVAAMHTNNHVEGRTQCDVIKTTVTSTTATTTTTALKAKWKIMQRLSCSIIGTFKSTWANCKKWIPNAIWHSGTADSYQSNRIVFKWSRTSQSSNLIELNMNCWGQKDATRQIETKKEPTDRLIWQSNCCRQHATKLCNLWWWVFSSLNNNNTCCGRCFGL